MIHHPNFDPVAFSLGPLSVHWYGMMYVLGFLGVYILGNYRVKHHPDTHRGTWNADQISDLIFWGAIGAVVGGRLGYVLFYKPMEYLSDPLEIFMVNEGGMSFHGGLLGVIVAISVFAQRNGRRLLDIGDFIAPLSAIGLFFGRMGNFINQELWGKPSDLPWAMVFTTDPQRLPRHPSMLYEAILEGLVLGLVVWWFARKPRAAGFLSGVFLIGYAVARMGVEFVRVPDAHLNYLLFGWVTMGHLLSLPLIALGLFLIFRKSAAN